MTFTFRGLMAPVLTPFENDNNYQRVLLDKIPAYAKYLADKQGIRGVLVNGTSGEGMSMTLDERKAVTEAWMRAAKTTKQIVMVQVGGACLKDVQDMAAHAEAHKVDALLCLPDLFNKPSTEEDLVSYLTHVGNFAGRTPLLYYHMPSYTNVNLDMSKLFEMAVERIPTFAGAKFTHTNLEEGARCLAVAKKHGLSLFLGCDNIMAGAFAHGFDSAIATTLNMYAKPSQTILECAEESRMAEALKEQLKLSEAITVMTRHGGWVAAMKAAMNLMTPIDVGLPRPPLHPIADEHMPTLKAELQRIKLI